MDDEVLYRLLDCDVAPACPLGPPPGADTAIDDVEHLVQLEEPQIVQGQGSNLALFIISNFC